MKYKERLVAWLNERFPPVNFVSGIFIFLLAKAVAIDPSESLSKFNIFDIFCSIVPMMHLFLLRVFDEHKDFESDKISYPDRILQKGIFTLKEVRVLGYGAFTLQIFFFLFLLGHYSFNSRLVFLFGILWIWTFLMNKEFFAKNWLKKHFLLYGFSHLLITPILFAFCIGLSNPYFNWDIKVILSLVLSLLTGWLYEVTRKTKAPEEEKKTDTSYSQIFGTKNSVIIIGFSLVLTHFFIWFLFNELNISSWVYWSLGMPLLGIGILSLIKFLKLPTSVARKKNEQAVALATLFAYLTPIIFWIIR
jgi:hypothetical protein